ncbi:hypothetical protein A2U01_0026040, partial [Trifolium medium]|nr:hypothetical protein [Trifolium medium]
CFGNVQGRALCDLGSSISLMPLNFAEKWEIGEIDRTHTMEIVLADQSVLRPSGIIKDVLVKIKDLIFPVDFIIIDIEEDVDVPIILGRPFLATSRVVINMEKEELKLRMGDKDQLIHIQKGKNDWCCRIDMKEPKSHGWRMKVTLEELEAGLAELDIEEEKPCLDLDMTDIKKEDLWVRRWGRFRKVAVRSNFGVNKIEVKKPQKTNMKIKFRKVIDSSKQPAEVKWVNVPREPKVEVKKSCVKGDIPREWDACYAFHKEQQMHDEKSEALVKARRETKRTNPLE